MAHDNVTRPAHYARTTLEPIQLIDALELGYYEGNVVKYVCRHTHKNGLEDLEKAAWYLDRLIARRKGEQRYPTIPTETTELVDTAQPRDAGYPDTFA